MVNGAFRNSDGSLQKGLFTVWLCPTCGHDTSTIIESKIENTDFGCRACTRILFRVDRGGLGPNLHQNTSNPGDRRVTVGKATEIDNRVIWHDGEVRNKKTRALAQY